MDSTVLKNQLLVSERTAIIFVKISYRIFDAFFL